MQKTNLVFLVDDDPSARRGLARLLRTAGYDVREFASAKEFLDAISSDVSGCLVMDLRMSGLSGEELQEELEARGVNLSIIVVTADDSPETRRKAKKMKAAGFYRKPVDGTALLDAIDWALRSNSTGDDHNKNHPSRDNLKNQQERRLK